MKKILVFFSCIFFVALFCSCPTGGESNDGKIIESGTKISDFTGHKNTLSWLLNKAFSDDGGKTDKFVFNDTEVIIGVERSIKNHDDTIELHPINYNIKKITYFTEATLPEGGAYTAPAGSYQFDLVNGEDIVSYIIEKNSENSFYLTVVSEDFDLRGAALRERIK